MRHGDGGNSEHTARQRVLTLVLSALAFLLGPATHAGTVARPCTAGPHEHGGGLNGCGCHFNRKTGECHCHRPRACGCECQPGSC